MITVARKWWYLAFTLGAFSLLALLAARSQLQNGTQQADGLQTPAPSKTTSSPLAGVMSETNGMAGRATETKVRVVNRTTQNANSSSGILRELAYDASTTLDDVIRSAIAERGISDSQVAELVDRATYECNQEPDPYDASNPKASDSTRQWAVDRVLDLCRKFDKGDYHLDPPPISDVAAIKVQLGSDAAVQQAFVDIATSDRRYSLALAGTLLFETNTFPYTDVWPGATRRFGLVELNRAWLLAVDLRLCREQGACGPQSFQVAVYCRERGCQEGSDLVAAYQANLAPDLFRLTMAFESWIASQR